jgi:hypothetical protein
MGRAVDSPTTFFLLWAMLLTLDIVWSVVGWRLQGGDKPKWALNNFVWLSIALIGYFLFPRLFNKLTDMAAPYGVYLLMIVEVSRSIVDYWLNWDYYFPWAPIRKEGRTVDNGEHN